jgi:hypothetical protein
MLVDVVVVVEVDGIEVVDVVLGVVDGVVIFGAVVERVVVFLVVEEDDVVVVSVVDMVDTEVVDIVEVVGKVGGNIMQSTSSSPLGQSS